MNNSIIDFNHLDDFATKKNSEYVNANPFPHITIPNFLSEDSLSKILSQVPKPHDVEIDWNYVENEQRDDGKTACLRKIWTADETALKPYLKQIIWELNSGKFLKILEKLTGIENLISDPHLYGGGIHQNPIGAYLDVHVDFNVHPIWNFSRRLNLLLFLNPNWNDEYGGELELWTPDMKTCVKKILPTANTCVVFNTSEISCHGHPNPVSCPDSMARTSIATYYYTNDQKNSETSHSTLWKQTPNESELISKQNKFNSESQTPTFDTEFLTPNLARKKLVDLYDKRVDLQNAFPNETIDSIKKGDPLLGWIINHGFSVEKISILEPFKEIFIAIENGFTDDDILNKFNSK